MKLDSFGRNSMAISASRRRCLRRIVGIDGEEACREVLPVTGVPLPSVPVLRDERAIEGASGS